MPVTLRMIFALALATAAATAMAETRTAVASDPGRAARVSGLQSQQRVLLTERATESAPKAANAPAVSVPPLPSANPLRAYPPSCLADPLPDQTSGPTYSTTANLAAYNSNTDQFILEGVTITVWRVVCSSSQFFTSATLLRIQRQSQFEGDRVIYPLFPSIEVNQGSIDFGETPESYVRSATSPNTLRADTLVDTPIPDSTTFVLENYSGNGAGFFDFNLAFGLRFNNLFNSNNFFFVSVPTYNPTAGTYPAAFQNLPISGYMSTNWFDPTANGEGIVLQIYEPVGDTQNLVVSFTWTAYDPSGIPFWLSGQATIARGAKTANATMFYRTGGGLGGNAGAASGPIIWGTATVSFPDCNTMVLTYASNPGQPSGIPTGNGTRTWQRIANVNALACE
jgi:hypothetical protein